MKPNGLTRPKVAREPMGPMFGPSGDSIGHAYGEVGQVHVAHLHGGAVARQTAGAQCGRTDLVRHTGQQVVLIMNWESWEVPKNSLMVAFTGRMLIRDCGVMASASWWSYARAPRAPYGSDQYAAGSGIDSPTLADTTVAEVVDIVDVHAGQRLRRCACRKVPRCRRSRFVIVERGVIDVFTAEGDGEIGSTCCG